MRLPDLPGSDPAALAATGARVRARLESDSRAARVPAEGFDVFAIRDVLPPEERAALIALIDADARPSGVFRAGGDGGMRTSHTCRLPAAHPLVAAVDARLAALLGLDPACSETVQGQRYHPGQQFREHNDYFAAGQPYSEAVAAEGGQRSWTAMLFLNEPEAGGFTHFPAIPLAFRPRAGVLLAWDNLDRAGHPNPRSHHAGLPVEAGVKYVLTKWFRERTWTPGAAQHYRN
ncbi:prolyl hydroxylase family protein [Sphingomonas canadensis]|uniref:Prolyl hydroxylase family protein n=1 Tax=Sphingomonas canadensis TaxID=1219257 RepID=A0ABW3HAP4_9SPHN|nr:2OG-Fe(II) oxygenase [Sphingomonas canadensis]MCW3836488.1 2OG-Fe(II) oxygenase [Sphingomonas canadensis]